MRSSVVSVLVGLISFVSNASLPNSSKPTSRLVTIHNTITPAMKTHSSLWGSHLPTKFELTVDGTILKDKDTITLPIENNTVTIGYNCDFLGGIHKSKRLVQFKLDPKATSSAITFDWKSPTRLMASGAKEQCVLKK